VSKYIRELIRQGEHQQLDFKFEISDYGKIAKSLVAFANTEGGKLLIGVKDNGSIAGIRSEEEVFMIEGAARMYCKPEVRFSSRDWEIDGRMVLEVDVKKGDHGNPHKVLDKDGKWRIYIRAKDQNLLANRVLLRVWKREVSGRGTYISFGRNEKKLLEYLERNGHISISGVRKLTGLKVYPAETLLVNFIMLGIIEMNITAKQTFYILKEGYEKRIREINESEGPSSGGFIMS
jgi:hypothetical protein